MSPVKTLPDEVVKELWRLNTEAKWSTRKLSGWLNERGYQVSREWVRKLLEGLAGTAGEPVQQDPGDDPDKQLLRLQHDAYLTAVYAAKQGNAQAQSIAVKTYIAALEARESRQKVTAILTHPTPVASAPTIVTPSFKTLPPHDPPP